MKNTKKALSLALALVMTMSLAACGPKESNGSASNETSSSAPAEPLDLTGEWKQTNGTETDYQAATIKDDTIEIYWVSEGDDTKSLYWAGTYTAPTDATESYTWDSENDTEKTSSALLASSDEKKTFTYEDGILNYEASALGTTKTMKLERIK